MFANWNWVLIIAGAILILVEVSFGGFAGFDLVLIGSSFLLGGGLGLLLGNPSIGLVVASALCLFYIALGRRWVRGRINRRTLVSNVDALVGERGVVTVRIAEHAPGQIRVRDEVWRAVPASGGAGPFEPGSIVTVEGVDGVTLQVR
jgi:membrane protein implicated in regulation of membrane protease activity